MKKLLLVIVIILAAMSSTAQWEPELQLTNDMTYSNTSINNAWSVAASGETIHVVWYGLRDGNYEIYYRRSKDAGSTWEQDVRLTADDFSSWLPSIAASGSLVLVAWGDNRDGNGDEIYYKRSTDNGDNWSEDTRLTYSYKPSYRPSVAISGSVVHIVWFDHLSDNFYAVYYTRSDDSGASWRPDTCLTFSSPMATSPSIAVSGSDVHIAWRDRRDGNGEIYYKHSTDGGLTWGEDIRLTNNAEEQLRPCISAQGSVVHVVWQDQRSGWYEIFYKRSDNGGLNWENETRLIHDFGDSSDPSIASSSSKVLVVWSDNRDADQEIYYKRSDNEGLNWMEDTRLTDDPGTSYRPSVAISGSSEHVLWTGQVDDFLEIFYKRYTNQQYRENLYYACKVWGFVKYFHSRVSVCEVNWDSVLVSTLPSIKNALTTDDFNDVLMSMLNAAGPMEIAITPSPDTLPPEQKRNLNFNWFDDAVFRDDVQTILDTIKNNFRPHPICWISHGGYLSFPYDDPMLDTNAWVNYPDESHRLLILFKYWNIINYMNPYNYVLDLPWDSTLYNNVLSLAMVNGYQDFFKIIKKITSDCNDAHVEALTVSTAYSMYGQYIPDIVLRYSQNNYIVVKSGYDAISKGDIIVSIDGKTPEQWEENLQSYISAGNSSVFRRSISQNMMRGAYGSPIEIQYKDSVGESHTLSTVRNYFWVWSFYPNDTLQNVKWKKWDCNVGYVNMENLLTSDVTSMYSELKNTSAIIFDLRNYPKGTGPLIADLIFPEFMYTAKVLIPDRFYPGTFSWGYMYFGFDGNPQYYSGQTIILCNQETQSQAENTCMILQAMPNSVVVGSQTAGTDGDISRFNMTQDIYSGYTSLGWYYPNGDSTERIGIVPDSVVYITPSGIRAGRDEVLEKALQVAGCLVPMLSVAPAAYEMTALPGTAEFIVTSNTNWSAMSDASWCTVTSSGSGNGTIIAYCDENTSYEPRIANIRVTAAGLPDQSVTISQAKSTIGIAEPSETKFLVYPNPTTGSFRVVSLNGEKEPFKFSIMDLTGKIMVEEHFAGKKEYNIDVSSHSQGFYFIIIKTNDNVLVHKLIIN